MELTADSLHIKFSEIFRKYNYPDDFIDAPAAKNGDREKKSETFRQNKHHPPCSSALLLFCS